MELLYVWAFVEILLTLYALYKLKKLVLAYKENKNVYYYAFEKLRNILIQVYRKPKIIQYVISEITVFYYAFYGWFVKKKSFENVSEYTYIKETMYGVFLWVIFISTMIEVPIVHYFLSLWSVTVAWVVTGVTLYGMIWLLGDYKAIKYMPIRINETHLFIRIGVRSKVDIALSNIDTISSHIKEEEKESYKLLVLMTTVDANIYITLKEKVHIKGIFGSKKEVDKIALYVDEPSLLMDAILNKKSKD